MEIGEDIPVPANPGPPGKWPLQWRDRERERREREGAGERLYCSLLYVVASNPLGMGLPLMGDGNYILLLYYL